MEGNYKSEITYGLCVDAFIAGSWHKGVVFSKVNDFANRLILFPNKSDDALIPTKNLRPTQEWNEVSGQWRQRGHWLFLEIIQEIERRKVDLPVSAREIWFQVQSTATFREKIEFWFRGSKLLWMKLVLDVIQEMISVIRLPETVLSDLHVGNGYCSDGADVNLFKERASSPASTTSCCNRAPGQTQQLERVCIRKQRCIEYNVFASGGKSIGNCYKHCLSLERKSCTHSLETCMTRNEVKGKVEIFEKLCSQDVSTSPKFALENKNSERSLASGDYKYWKLEELEGEYWHDALKILHAKNFQTEKIKFRKHLVAVGWRIESKRDAVIRFRYISPEGITYYSLIKASQHLFESEADMKNKLHEIAQGIPENQPTGRLTHQAGSSELLNFNTTPATSPENIGENAQTEGLVEEPLDSQEAVVNEDSEVIAAYMGNINKPKDRQKLPNSEVSVLRSKVKEFLLGKGWTFWLKDKKERKELRYTSPTGKTYASLYTACKGYLEAVIPKFSAKISMDKVPICSDLTNVDDPKAFEVQQEGVEEGLSHSSGASNSVDIGSRKKNLDESQCVKRRKTEKKLSTMLLDRQPLTCLDANFSITKDAEKDSRVTSTRDKTLDKILPLALRRSGKRSRQIMYISIRAQAAKTVLSWLIDKNVVLPRDKVTYIRKRDGRIMKEGCIYHDGIRCRCCQKVFSLSEFEAHAGEKASRPSASVALRDGRSLLDCLKQIIFAIKPKEFQHARLKQNYSHHEADYVCTVCQDGGTLLLCDLCPSAFHPTCIGLEGVPQGNWFCPSCRCGICSMSEFSCDTEHFSENSGIYCDQCERQYHVSCMLKREMQIRSCPVGKWTCSKECSKIFHHLHWLLGRSNPTPVKGLSWTILKSNKEYISKLDDESIAENYGKLYIALDVLHECFDTMIESRTQSDVAADLIFNRISELNRLNFWGFYTMLLMRGDELLCVATFRVFGEKLAEIPLIGTRIKFRRQGFCRLLMDELQKLLSSLGVIRLLLPAVPELVKTWTTKFGFSKMTDSDRLEFLEYTTLSFLDTTICYKFLKRPSFSMD